MTLINSIRTAAAKRAAYRRTRDEIARLPEDIARDLDMSPADASEIARKAVYGY